MTLAINHCSGGLISCKRAKIFSNLKNFPPSDTFCGFAACTMRASTCPPLISGPSSSSFLKIKYPEISISSIRFYRWRKKLQNWFLNHLNAKKFHFTFSGFFLKITSSSSTFIISLLLQGISDSLLKICGVLITSIVGVLTSSMWVKLLGVKGVVGEGKECCESLLAWGLCGGVGRNLVEEDWSRSFFGGSAGFTSLLFVFGGTLNKKSFLKIFS